MPRPASFTCLLSPCLPSRGIRPRADIRKAKEILLDEWLGDFRFADPASRAHAVAFALSPIVRPRMGLSPLQLVDAAAPGSGKTLLAKTAGLIATGTAVPVRPFDRSETERRKLILALLMSAPRVVVVDNLKGAVDSAALEALLTSAVWADRILGESRDVVLPNNTTWSATSNNAKLSPDLVRRSYLVRLDTGLEHPDQRLQSDFRHPDLAAEIASHGERYAWALLTLVQHWISEGMPLWQGALLGGYEEHGRVVGGILEAAGIDGFLGNRGELRRRADIEGEELRTFVEVWLDWQERSATNGMTSERRRRNWQCSCLTTRYSCTRWDKGTTRPAATYRSRPKA